MRLFQENPIRLEELRLDLNLKQKDIANILKVKRNTYSKWETAINDISLEICNELANFYNVSMDYLLGLTNYSENTSGKLNLNLLPNRLTEERKIRGLSQQELGDKVGFTQRAYSNYETGTRVITTLKLLAIAQFYNISIDYLVGRTPIKEIKRKSIYM